MSTGPIKVNNSETKDLMTVPNKVYKKLKKFMERLVPDSRRRKEDGAASEKRIQRDFLHGFLVPVKSKHDFSIGLIFLN